MKDYTDTERLLDDTLTEETAAEFRQALLDQTLRLARRRRYLRRARRAGLALALITGVLWLSWNGLVQDLVHPVRPYVLVSTRPLSHEQVVESRPLPLGTVVSTTALQNTLTTAEAGYQAREINDEDLLALAAPNLAVLIWHGPHTAELVMAKPSEVR